jgi:hypothetical protein
MTIQWNKYNFNTKNKVKLSSLFHLNLKPHIEELKIFIPKDIEVFQSICPLFLL